MLVIISPIPVFCIVPLPSAVKPSPGFAKAHHKVADRIIQPHPADLRRLSGRERLADAGTTAAFRTETPLGDSTRRLSPAAIIGILQEVVARLDPSASEAALTKFPPRKSRPSGGEALRHHRVLARFCAFSARHLSRFSKSYSRAMNDTSSPMPWTLSFIYLIPSLSFEPCATDHS